MATLSGLPTYPKLDETNYANWSVDTKALLQSQMLWRLVNETQTKPKADSSDAPERKLQQTALDNWEDRAERACADDPVAIWKALKSVHEAQQPGNRYNAYNDLFSIKKRDNESLSALIMRTEQGIHLIKALRPETGFDIVGDQ
ncbi:hypothetical protein FIBSPDRAFT_891911 [Athelia psychrophila]|uniref:DUF4219 domain-containing protein n=1 Tax=Athelia psychrophila TaxID=1759441 RepID=A0A166J176_9AGAM|nr:hypothetical protein FIBSPDRAFT_891911 [Fibularhizoctonia sp. CBS 109695]